MLSKFIYNQSCLVKIAPKKPYPEMEKKNVYLTDRFAETKPANLVPIFFAPMGFLTGFVTIEAVGALGEWLISGVPCLSTEFSFDDSKSLSSERS